jgi:Tfp pilus assembly protein PilO
VRAQIRVIGAAAVALVVCLLFFVFFIRPRQSDVSRIETEITAAQGKQQQLTLELQNLQALQENAPELNATLQQIRGFVPKDDEVPNFIFQVQEAANAAGIELVKLTPELPKTPAEPAPLAEIRVTLSATGEFFSLQDFIRRLYSLDRALRIDTLALAAEGAAAATSGGDTNTTTTSTAPAAEPGELTLTVAARVFFELPEGVVPGAPAPTTETSPAPGETPATEPTPAETGAPVSPPADPATAP